MNLKRTNFCMHRSRLRAIRLQAIVAVMMLLLVRPILANEGRSQPIVMHTLKPLQLITNGLSGDLLDTRLLSLGAQQAHSYTVKFSDLQKIQQSQLLVWMGAEFEHYLQKPLDALQPAVLDFAWLSASAAHGGEALVEHLWLDPAIVASRISRLAEKLAQVQPDQRTEYNRRATVFTARVLKLDAEMIALFAPYKGRGVVADHHGIELFLRRYGLRYVGSLQSANHSSLSLKQVRRLRTEVRLKNAECVVLSDPHAGTDLLQIFSGLEIATAQVDILGEQADTYEQLIRQLGENIASCLSKQ
ncbi:MAG: metal ABC transporter solute-binding protein, Zn/Mn family [Pseudomonadales bacterium]